MTKLDELIDQIYKNYEILALGHKEWFVMVGPDYFDEIMKEVMAIEFCAYKRLKDGLAAFYVTVQKGEITLYIKCGAGFFYGPMIKKK